MMSRSGSPARPARSAKMRLNTPSRLRHEAVVDRLLGPVVSRGVAPRKPLRSTREVRLNPFHLLVGLPEKVPRGGLLQPSVFNLASTPQAICWVLSLGGRPRCGPEERDEA